jgi:hypothetical protein
MDSGKEKSVIIEFNEIAYTELILSINFKITIGKVALNIIKANNAKDYLDGNASIAWGRLKNKY